MKTINDLEFNLTPKMQKDLLNFDKLKRKSFELLELYDSTEDKSLIDKMIAIEKQKDKCKHRFIKQFKESNKVEIEEYNKLKNSFKKAKKIVN